MDASTRACRAGTPCSSRDSETPCSGGIAPGRDEANAKRAEASRAQVATQPRDEAGRVVAAEKPEATAGDEPGHAPRGAAPGDKRNHADVQLANRAGVSERTAERTQALGNKRPDLLEKVAAGDVKLTEAMRQAKRDELAARSQRRPQEADQPRRTRRQGQPPCATDAAPS